MTKIYNTPLEISMRVLIILRCWGKPVDIEIVKETDLLSIYGKFYGITEENLNGDNSYAASEVSGKHQQIKDALVLLSANGLAYVSNSNKGFIYKITEEGEKFCQALNSDYKDEYMENCYKTISFIKEHGASSVRKMVLKSAIRRE